MCTKKKKLSLPLIWTWKKSDVRKSNRRNKTDSFFSAKHGREREREGIKSEPGELKRVREQKKFQ